LGIVVRPMCFAAQPGEALLRVDVALEAAQHFALIDRNETLLKQLLDASREALEEGTLWATVPQTLCDLVVGLEFEALDDYVVERSQPESKQQ